MDHRVCALNNGRLAPKSLCILRAAACLLSRHKPHGSSPEVRLRTSIKLPADVLQLIFSGTLVALSNVANRSYDSLKKLSDRFISSRLPLPNSVAFINCCLVSRSIFLSILHCSSQRPAEPECSSITVITTLQLIQLALHPIDWGVTAHWHCRSISWALAVTLAHIENSLTQNGWREDT